MTAPWKRADEPPLNGRFVLLALRDGTYQVAQWIEGPHLWRTQCCSYLSSMREGLIMAYCDIPEHPMRANTRKETQ